MEEIIKLKCQKCGCDYEKPSILKKHAVEAKDGLHVFYEWSLTFCDKCRREKQGESLIVLPSILNLLSKI
jgi:hypothetical protein